MGLYQLEFPSRANGPHAKDRLDMLRHNDRGAEPESNITEIPRKDGSPPMVDLRGVVKTYKSAAGTFIALDGIDLRIGAGEFRSIMGKSGSGKSTLINMITGIDRPTDGEVLVNGIAVHTLNEEQVAVWRGRTVGVIFQFFQLLPSLTAVENVMLPMDYAGQTPARERPRRAMHLLGQVGVADQAHNLPATLSGGQQQCIAIARALANNPPVLAADEPTGNLDSSGADRVMRLFQDLAASGKTILMVTHDRDLAKSAQRILVLADGRIVNEE
jgi:putative ABC transport system ATP-binding protein